MAWEWDTKTSSCCGNAVQIRRVRVSWRTGTIFRDLVAFPKIDEDGELYLQSGQKLPVRWRRRSKLKMKRAPLDLLSVGLPKR